jgi:predicted dehydrogenase/threonine dehydrogenase-like Zn-dependent dehydrogenase
MKQILQDLKNGTTMVVDVPCPAPGRGQVLIRSSRTLVSAGTERMLVDFGKAGWIDKVRQQPDKVQMVIDKVRTDGLLPTIAAVRNKLNQPLPMGYCNVGTIIGIGEGVGGLAVGDRVVSNGRHAEVVTVPANLCVKVPEGVEDESAAFTVLGAIALQGIRLAEPSLGEAVVVTGLGLIGLLAVQLLKAQGCRVLGVDFDPTKLALARSLGAEVVDLRSGADPVAAAQAFSRGRGIDAVLITAATDSNEPVHQAALMCRKRGRIVLVGVAGLELSRADFYEKELSFQVSCSYGPGRYDVAYEERGQDYPVGFVRWTAQRNFEAVLDMLAAGRLDARPLVSHRFALEDAARAYDIVAGSEPSLGILLTYGNDGQSPDASLLRRTIEFPAKPAAGRALASLGFVGAGNYASAVLIPAFRETGARLLGVASAGGLSSVHAARRFGFELATTDVPALLANDGIDAVVISTRHDSHCSLVLQAKSAGKHVFVEKPLCLTLDELARIEQAWADPATILMVGFNRRFAPHVRRMRSLLDTAPGPKSFVVTVNAGAVPGSHWTQDEASGGGRLIGECCHFVDLLRYLAAAGIADFGVAHLGTAERDSAVVTLRFEDGSIGSINYFANGSKKFPKERVEVFAAGRVLQLDNFRHLRAYGWPGFSRMSLWRQDKGQRACAEAFVAAVRGDARPPIPLGEILEVSRVSIEIGRSAR